MERSNTWIYDLWEEKTKNNSMNWMKEKGFGSRFTGYVFSEVHSDLVTELFNKETKGTSGPSR